MSERKIMSMSEILYFWWWQWTDFDFVMNMGNEMTLMLTTMLQKKVLRNLGIISCFLAQHLPPFENHSFYLEIRGGSVLCLWCFNQWRPHLFLAYDNNDKICWNQFSEIASNTPPLHSTEILIHLKLLRGKCFHSRKLWDSDNWKSTLLNVRSWWRHHSTSSLHFKMLILSLSSSSP